MQLRIIDDIVQTVGTIHRVCRVIARHDPDLSRQMRRAINSVGLNSGEGLSARGGNRTVRIESAMSSGREVILGLRKEQHEGARAWRRSRARMARIATG